MPRFLRPPLATPVALALATVALVFATSAWSSPATSPRAHAAATCADYPNQAAAQRAADTRDPDGDGLLLRVAALPVRGTGRSPRPPPAPGRPRPLPAAAARRPAGVQPISFSKTKYPHIRRHFRAALRRGWPRTLVLNRPRRRRPPRPPARRTSRPATASTATSTRRRSAAARARASSAAAHPRGWKADVRYVPSSENRSHGSALGIKLRRFCDGTRFRYVFY